MISKILVTDGLEENGLAILRSQADVVLQPGITPEQLLLVIGDYEGLIVRGRTKVTPAVLAAGVKLKVVGRAGVGVDNIDLVAAAGHQVTVVNTPIATTIAVAELAMGLMLAMAREIPRADASMKNGHWLKKELEGIELYGKTLGIIGYGRIGAAVGQRAAAFGMMILGYDPLIPANTIRERGAQPTALTQIYAQADFLSIHVPLTKETHGMLNAAAFAQMKPGVCIICAAQGGIIAENDLLAALESGQVGFAGLDVFATEPPGKTALVSHPHVINTPHIGAQTVEAQRRAAADIATEVLSALKGEALRWKVA